jgi:hypothetical protein
MRAIHPVLRIILLAAGAAALWFIVAVRQPDRPKDSAALPRPRELTTEREISMSKEVANLDGLREIIHSGTSFGDESDGNPTSDLTTNRGEALSIIRDLMEGTLREFDTAKNEEEYSLAWRTYAKLVRAEERLFEGDYEIVDKGALEKRDIETADQSVLAISASPNEYHFFIFEREKESSVFAAIDGSAAMQQEAWFREADEFNSRPLSTREQLVAADASAKKAVSDLLEKHRNRTETSNSQETGELQNLRSALSGHHKNLLPYYLVVKADRITVAARRSIGR